MDDMYKALEVLKEGCKTKECPECGICRLIFENRTIPIEVWDIQGFRERWNKNEQVSKESKQKN